MKAQNDYDNCEKKLKSGESSAAIKSLLKLARAIMEFARGHIKDSLGYLKQMV